MAITFGKYTQFYPVLHYDTNTSTQIADVTNSIASDVFPNGTSIAVGDSIYFGAYDYQLSSGRGYIGKRLSVRMDLVQPVIATTFEVIWEYSTSIEGTSTTLQWKPLNVVSDTLSDGTLPFNKVGVGEVKWDLPLDIEGTIYPPGLAGQYYKTWIRCRVIAISGLTQQPAWGNQKVDGFCNALVISNYPESSPTNYAQLWEYVLTNDVKNKQDIKSIATSGTTTTLTDTTKNWFADSTNKEYEHRGKIVIFTGGTNAGEYARIVSNTNDTLILNKTLPAPIDNTTQYTIIQPLVMNVHDKFRGGTDDTTMMPFFYYLECGILFESAFIQEPKQGTLAFYGGVCIYDDIGGNVNNGILSGTYIGGDNTKEGTTVSILRRGHYSSGSTCRGRSSKFYNRIVRNIMINGYQNNYAFSDWGTFEGEHIGCHIEWQRSGPLDNNVKFANCTISSGSSNNVEPPQGFLKNVSLPDSTVAARTNGGISNKIINNLDMSQTKSMAVQAYGNSTTNTSAYNYGYFIDCKWNVLPFTYDAWGSANNNNNQGIYVGFTRSYQTIEKNGTPIQSTFKVIDEKGTVVLNRQANEDGFINSEFGTCDNTSTTEILTDPTKNWTTDEWKYRKVLITNDDSRKNIKFEAIVVSNTATSLTIFPKLPATPNSNTRFIIIPYFLEGRYYTPDNVQTLRESFQDHVFEVSAVGYESVKINERVNYISPGGQIVLKKRRETGFDGLYG